MKKLGLLAAASFVLVASPQMALSKPSVLKIQPEGSQLAIMESGAQVVTSQMAESTVVMRAPEPFEGKRTRIFFTFVNNSQFPVNVGPENVTSTQVAVIGYDQLLAEQKKSEGADKFFAAIGAVGKALSATDAGHQTSTTSYSGYVDCGIGCGGTYRGSAVSRTYSPYAAQQAQAQAAAENAAAASEMHSRHASARNAIARNLQTTTINSGHYIIGMLTFEVPKAVRRGKKAVPISLAIRIGSDVHILRGFAGPIGAPPPAVSSIAMGQISSPKIASSDVARMSTSVQKPQRLTAVDISNFVFPCSDYCADPDGRRLQFATQSPDTRPHQKAKMIELIQLNRTADGVNWRGAADAYFSWRNVDEARYLPAAAAQTRTAAPQNNATSAPRLLNGNSLMTSSDYPAGSKARGEEGIVTFQLAVKDGRAVSCAIAASSGYPELDDATCQLMVERSAFDTSPSRNGVWSTFVSRVRWNLEPIEPRPFHNNLTATQSVSRIDPNKIRCQYSDGYVGFVNAGNPCIKAAAAPAQQANPDLMATISKAVLEGRCEDAKTVALTSGRLDLADQAMRLCKPAAKQ